MTSPGRSARAPVDARALALGKDELRGHVPENGGSYFNCLNGTILSSPLYSSRIYPETPSGRTPTSNGGPNQLGSNFLSPCPVIKNNL